MPRTNHRYEIAVDVAIVVVVDVVFVVVIAKEESMSVITYKLCHW